MVSTNRKFPSDLVAFAEKIGALDDVYVKYGYLDEVYVGKVGHTDYIRVGEFGKYLDEDPYDGWDVYYYVAPERMVHLNCGIKDFYKVYNLCMDLLDISQYEPAWKSPSHWWDGR